MLMVYQIKPEKREQIPAVTHVDGRSALRELPPLARPVIAQ